MTTVCLSHIVPVLYSDQEITIKKINYSSLKVIEGHQIKRKSIFGV